uniref:Uncharacterized protein n=1 Tax=Leersia perrieri TaxID=77586 RepID=A0A0D9WFW6_9ORYZ
MLKQVNNWAALSMCWLDAALYSQKFEPLEAAGGASGSLQHIPQHLLEPVRIECQDHAMMALGVLLNLQGKLQDKHGEELAAHWRAVRALARKLDKERY